MRKLIRCGKLFTGSETNALSDHTLVIEDDKVAFAGPTAKAPEEGPHDEVIDHSRHFVMPGLIDSHVHLSYGNAKTQEDIDLYASVEFRAIRGLEAAQRVLRAGYTAMADLSISGRVSLAVRDAIEAGLFAGPRVSSSGRALTTRQGLDDWYPRWIGVPETSIGVLVRNVAEGIEEVRGQVKDGVNFVKLAMDGDAMNPATGMIAGFNQEETSALITEIHRLGKKAVCHARGAEAVRSTLSPRGTLVSFAAMSLNPMSISPLDVIFKPVTVRGFFMAHAEFAAKLAPAAAQAAEMIASGRMHIPVAATYPLSSIKEAVAHAQRGGKILLDVAGSST
jgi:imidazolonepropionase-like amidohydrolase